MFLLLVPPLATADAVRLQAGERVVEAELPASAPHALVHDASFSPNDLAADATARTPAVALQVGESRAAIGEGRADEAWLRTQSRDAEVGAAGARASTREGARISPPETPTAVHARVDLEAVRSAASWSGGAWKEGVARAFALADDGVALLGVAAEALRKAIDALPFRIQGAHGIVRMSCAENLPCDVLDPLRKAFQSFDAGVAAWQDAQIDLALPATGADANDLDVRAEVAVHVTEAPSIRFGLLVPRVEAAYLPAAPQPTEGPLPAEEASAAIDEAQATGPNPASHPRSANAARPAAGAGDLEQVAAGARDVAGSSAHPTGAQAAIDAPPLGGVLAAALVLALAIPVWLLYRRVDARNALANPQRRRILDRIVAEPGITAADLARLTGLHYTSCEHHVRMLEASGHVYVLRVAGSKRCFENHGRYGAVEARALAASRVPGSFALLRLAARADGVSLSEAARALGRSVSTTKHHADRLTALGLLCAKRRGRCVLYRVPAPALDGVLFAVARAPAVRVDVAASV
ncbi:MAG TPA: winged helix-turn-helix transcriptional regulator [Candidatus Thermoplasmatota archaeon]|nr:winged helix-turn-helix transcriptional regulator [Candidatus Thermoplasmatota archaeon]